MLVSIASLLLISTVAAQPWRAVNLASGVVYEHDGSSSPPSDVQRIRLQVTNAETSSNGKPLLVHIVRLRWSPPARWNTEEKNGNYHLICELHDTVSNESFSLVDRQMANDVTGLDERFSLPSSVLTLICAVRAENEKAKSHWRYSRLVTIDARHAMKAESEAIPATDIDGDVISSIVHSELDPIEEFVTHQPNVMMTDVDSETSSTFEATTTTTTTTERELRREELLDLLHKSDIVDLPPLVDRKVFDAGRGRPVVVTSPTVEEQAEEPDFKAHSLPDTAIVEMANAEMEKLESTTPDSEPVEIVTEQPAETPIATPAEPAILAESDAIFETTPIEASTEASREAEFRRNSVLEGVNEAVSLASPVIVMTTSTTTAATRDIFISGPRVDWTPNAETSTETLKVFETESLSSDDESTTTPPDSDYDVLESQLREAIGADGNVDRLHELLQFGLHDRLLRVL